jgi:hypothetical protein
MIIMSVQENMRMNILDTTIIHRVEKTYSKNPTGACAPTSLLKGMALIDTDLEVFTLGVVKAETETARIKARTARMMFGL